MKFKLLISFFLFITTIVISQNNDGSNSILSQFFTSIHSLKMDNSGEILKKVKDDELQNHLQKFLILKRNNGYSKHSLNSFINSIDLEEIRKESIHAIRLLILSENELKFNLNRTKSYNLAYKGYIYSKNKSLLNFQREFLLQILYIFRSGIVNNDRNINQYFRELEELSSNNEVYLFKQYLIKNYLIRMGILNSESENSKNKNKLLKSDYFINKLDSLVKNFEPENKLLIDYYHVKGLHSINSNNRKALEYLQKEEQILNSCNSTYFNYYKYENYKEIARVYGLLKKYIKAKETLKKTLKVESKINVIKNEFVYNLYESDLNYGIQKYDSAFYNMKNAFHKSLQLNFKNQNDLISALEVKNKTKQKELENLELRHKRKQDQIILLVGGIFIILGSLIAYLNLKNSRKKRLLAEQQKELEKQKNLTLLKEQEITTINAMVEGQEKERIRIAEDLHDNIGSVLATLKLHFENLKLNREKKHFNQEELYNKTEKLIDETYLKVRSIAHAKNAGVIANQGLLVAIKIMAEKISSANKLKIEIVDFGLDKRIDTNTEITAFRIIQELVTNIIKHAEATNASINISLFEDNLNIIIEDNGKGFNSQEINYENSMGIGSIKKRIEHLKGTFQIDSAINRGTSIIINIPS